MLIPPATRRRATLYPLIVAAIAILLLTTLQAQVAQAHGSIVDPASRNYGCWQRWGSDFQNPAMATQDPMCWQAWQADPNAMWNWNGLYREGVAGNHQGAIPDGQLCSGGRTQSGRYNAMDTVGAWKTTRSATTSGVTLLRPGQPRRRLHPGVRHQAGLRPATQPLRWSDLELVGQIGNTPAASGARSTGGVLHPDPGRTRRAAPAGTSSTRSGRPATWTSRTTSAVTSTSAAGPAARRRRHPRRRRGPRRRRHRRPGRRPPRPRPVGRRPRPRRRPPRRLRPVAARPRTRRLRSGPAVSRVRSR